MGDPLLYQESHPWITFDATAFNNLSKVGWMRLGEARAKCEDLAGTPIAPAVAQRISSVTLVKGAHATAAIEGNTLTVEQAQGIADGTFKAPTSREYQEREIRNVLEVLSEVDRQVIDGKAPPITLNLICEFNRRILEGTDYDDEAVPGQIRTYNVGVMDYRGVPHESCEHLVERLCEWLESDKFNQPDAPPEIQFATSVAAAIYAHLYMAWIHPFGDGNGRTARLIEFLILARSGQIPVPAAALLSDHYNLTRDRYYRELSRASKASDTIGFAEYAIEGLVDGLREQMSMVRAHQMGVAWTNYVHETMNELPATATRDRQRTLVLAMGAGEPLPKDDLTGLTPKVAQLYAKAGSRLLGRDLNRLAEFGLVVKLSGGRWRSNAPIMAAFLPKMAGDGNDDS
ncbi:MAG: Fic family protein [bacterium]|nr:Fic family protein [bacterium]